MREIKFRYRLKLISNDWGDYKEGDIGTYFISLNNEYNGLYRFSIDERWEVVSCDEYTGFKDKNGSEIYEGDIIKFHTGIEQRDLIQEKVCYNQGCFGFRSLDHDGVNVISSFTPLISVNQSLMDRDIFKDESEILEVIGNIHENPKLKDFA